MNRKQMERAAAKHDKGLGKKLRNVDMDEWGEALQLHEQQILINHGLAMEGY